MEPESLSEAASEAATPVFVVGTARAGTTWLGNLLASHTHVAAVACPEHHGMVESHLLDYTRYALPGTLTAQEFLTGYSGEDYFRAMELDPQAIKNMSEGPGDAIEHFDRLMQVYAREQNAAYWLEKTPKHAVYVDELMKRFPTARFVVIRRSANETLRSQVAAFGRPGAPRYRVVLEKAFRYASDMRGIERLERRAADRTVSLSYEELVESTPRQTEKIQRFLGIPQEPLFSVYERFASFPDGNRSSTAINRSASWMISACVRLVRLLPYAAVVRIRTVHDRRQVSDGPLYSRVADGHR